MRKALIVFLIVLSLPVSAYLVFAQAEHQVDDKGYIDIGSYKETPTKQRPSGSLYRGNGVTVFAGKPPKPYVQTDMHGYEVDPVPANQRNKPYDKHDLNAHGTWEGITGGGGRIPPMTDAGYAAFETSVVAGGPRGNLANSQQQTDPYLVCDPFGTPRAITGGVLEFFEFPTQTLIHKTFHDSWTKIWTDGRLLPKEPIDPSFAGYWVGKWVDTPGASTFVADGNGVDDRTWLDGAGLRHSLGATFQARYRRIQYPFLQVNLTIKDPAYYKETWEIGPILEELYPNTEADIWPCVPSEELLYRELSPTEQPRAGAK